MSTRAAIIMQNTDGKWIHIYCHFDGYPENMLPALNAHACKAIADAREIRTITTDRIDAFSDARQPEVKLQAIFPEWAAHAYILTHKGWQHAKDQDQLDATRPLYEPEEPLRFKLHKNADGGTYMTHA